MATAQCIKFDLVESLDAHAHSGNACVSIVSNLLLIESAWIHLYGHLTVFIERHFLCYFVQYFIKLYWRHEARSATSQVKCIQRLHPFLQFRILLESQIDFFGNVIVQVRIKQPFSMLLIPFLPNRVYRKITVQTLFGAKREMQIQVPDHR